MQNFSLTLQKKIAELKDQQRSVLLGKVSFASPLLLAPMSGISNQPFRRLMQDLGAGGTVSELISCHGINHGNERTRQMLLISPDEQCTGIQLFGDEAQAMARAAQVAEKNNPQFIDINMGCPVRKVVGKGAGAALLKESEKLPLFLQTIKSAIQVPLSIKIRTGWDEENRNALDICHIARDCEVEWVAIHGRTRTQAYNGKADWNFIEELAKKSTLPLIGNGDLSTAQLVREKLHTTQCAALMLGRGPLRHPFIFLESLGTNDQIFEAQDYFEVFLRLSFYAHEYFTESYRTLTYLKKFLIWFATGFRNASHFRQSVFSFEQLDQLLNHAQDYFQSLGNTIKDDKIAQESFLQAGHG